MSFQLPFQQGDILAHNWNTQIKRHFPASSLDALMVALFVLVKSDPSATSTEESFSERAKQYGLGSVADDIKSMHAGTLVVPDPGSLGPCVTQINTSVVTKSGQTVIVPQFVLDQSKWTANAVTCTAWFSR